MLRFAALLALSVWVGGLLALGGVAAPAVFDVVDARHVADGRVLSGAVFAEILRRFHLVAYGCGGLLVAILVARAVLGPRPRHFAVRLSIAVLMVAATIYSGMFVTSRIEALRDEIGAAPSSLPPTDSRRVRFGRLHAQSNVLQFVPIVGGMILMLLEVREGS